MGAFLWLLWLSLLYVGVALGTSISVVVNVITGSGEDEQSPSSWIEGDGQLGMWVSGGILTGIGTQLLSCCTQCSRLCGTSVTVLAGAMTVSGAALLLTAYGRAGESHGAAIPALVLGAISLILLFPLCAFSCGNTVNVLRNTSTKQQLLATKASSASDARRLIEREDRTVATAGSRVHQLLSEADRESLSFTQLIRVMCSRPPPALKTAPALVARLQALLQAAEADAEAKRSCCIDGTALPSTLFVLREAAGQSFGTPNLIATEVSLSGVLQQLLLDERGADSVYHQSANPSDSRGISIDGNTVQPQHEEVWAVLQRLSRVLARFEALVDAEGLSKEAVDAGVLTGQHIFTRPSTK